MREPRGDRRTDYLAAQITQAIYTIMASFGGGKTTVKLEDCILKFNSGDDDYTQEEADRRTLASIAAVSALFGKSSRDFVAKAKAKVAEVNAAKAAAAKVPVDKKAKR